MVDESCGSLLTSDSMHVHVHVHVSACGSQGRGTIVHVLWNEVCLVVQDTQSPITA